MKGLGYNFFLLSLPCLPHPLDTVVKPWTINQSAKQVQLTYIFQSSNSLLSLIQITTGKVVIGFVHRLTTPVSLSTQTIQAHFTE